MRGCGCAIAAAPESAIAALHSSRVVRTWALIFFFGSRGLLYFVAWPSGDGFVPGTEPCTFAAGTRPAGPEWSESLDGATA
jgi:hypothetical protein